MNVAPHASREICAFLFCFFTTPLLSMDAIEHTKEKPDINGYIIPLSIHYTSPEMHNEINQIGNFGSNMYTPVVEVDVYTQVPFLNHIFSWTNYEPGEVRNFENETHLNTNITERPLKLFPRVIPITCFHNAQQGTLLSPTIHGYKTNLMCCTCKTMSKKTNDPRLFQETFKELQKQFLKCPSTIFSDPEKNKILIQNQIIQQNNTFNYTHGERGYVRNEQLISTDHPLKVILPYIMNEKALLLLQSVRALEDKNNII